MIRAPDGVLKQELRRQVIGPEGKPYVLTITERAYTLRPLGSWRGSSAHVSGTWAALVTRELMARPTRRRRRHVSRGILGIVQEAARRAEGR